MSRPSFNQCWQLHCTWHVAHKNNLKNSSAENLALVSLSACLTYAYASFREDERDLAWCSSPTTYIAVKGGIALRAQITLAEVKRKCAILYTMRSTEMYPSYTGTIVLFIAFDFYLKCSGILHTLFDNKTASLFLTIENVKKLFFQNEAPSACLDLKKSFLSFNFGVSCHSG